MANHDYLPRNGKNIGYDELRFAISHAFNFEPHTFDGAMKQYLDANFSRSDTPASSLNLDDLATLGAHQSGVEFDGSISRGDIYTGNNIDYDPRVFGPVAKDLGLDNIGWHHHDKFVTIEVAAKARYNREKVAVAENKWFNASESQMTGSPGTTALYLLTMWDDDEEAAPKSWVKSFFGKFGGQHNI